MRDIALFDLDYTLIDVDSEELWSSFLAGQGRVDGEYVERIGDYYEAYQSGRMDFRRFEEYLLSPLVHLEPEVLADLVGRYLELVRAHFFPAMTARLAAHRAQGDALLLITASSSFLARPIGKLLGFADILCTEAEVVAGRLTGRITGTPAFRAGKIRLLTEWLGARGYSFRGSWGYSDSHNDLPLLRAVEHPVAVQPNEQLRAYAEAHGWEILTGEPV